VPYRDSVSRITVSVHIAAPADEVWTDVSDLGSHTAWMADAESIEFFDAQISGVGTRMKVATRVGPFRTVDIMEVTEWQPGSTIGVEHRGIVTGTGAFSIEPRGDGTRFTWSETLSFPWWLGGAVVAWLARPVLAAIWRRNLDRLKDRIEQT